MKKHTSALFKLLLEKSNLSHEKFALLNKMTRPQVSRYLNGITGIGYEKACELAKKYDVDLNEIINTFTTKAKYKSQ